MNAHPILTDSFPPVQIDSLHVIVHAQRFFELCSAEVVDVRIIRGIWSNERLVSPGQRVRPTHEPVRDAWMNHLQPMLDGCRLLDLFAGSGSLGLEGLSRGAASVDFVDNSADALHALKANVASRKLGKMKKGQRPSRHRKSARIFKRDAIPFVKQLGADAYDIALADPPYGSLKLDRVVEQWHRVPFAPVLCVEHGPGHKLPAGTHQISFEASVITIYTNSDLG